MKVIPGRRDEVLDIRPQEMRVALDLPGAGAI
jgi:hypothetical protein